MPQTLYRRVTAGLLAHPVRANAVFAATSFVYVVSLHAAGVI